MGIGYFQNLTIFLGNCFEFFWILGEFFDTFLGVFGGMFLEEFFYKDFFGGRDSFFILLKLFEYEWESARATIAPKN